MPDFNKTSSSLPGEDHESQFSDICWKEDPTATSCAPFQLSTSTLGSNAKASQTAPLIFVPNGDLATAKAALVALAGDPAGSGTPILANAVRMKFWSTGRTTDIAKPLMEYEAPGKKVLEWEFAFGECEQIYNVLRRFLST